MKKTEKETYPLLKKLLSEIKNEKKHMGRKKVREPHWKLFEYVNTILSNKKIVYLLMMKIIHQRITEHKIEPNKNDGIGYLYSFFEVEEGQRTISINKELSRLDKEISQTIGTLNVLIRSGLKWVVQDRREAWKWVFDVFGEDAKEYLPDWHDFYKPNRSKNKPDFKKSLALLKRFLKKESYKDMGLIEKKTRIQSFFAEVEKTKKKAGYFCTKQRPQGVIKLLYEAHNIIHIPRKIAEEELKRGTPSSFIKMLLSQTPLPLTPVIISH